MSKYSFSAAVAAAALTMGSAAALAQADKPILIGVPTAIQQQVGRDTQDTLQMQIDDINAKGGILGRKLQMVVEDETEEPEKGVTAVKKLIDQHVDVLIGGYTSGVTLAQLPHISQGKTIYLGIGAASPATQAKVKTDYDHYKYIFRVGLLNSLHQADATVSFITDVLKPQIGVKRIAIIGENAKWVQDLAPALKKGAEAGGVEVPLIELFDTQMSDFSPLLAKVKDAKVDFLAVILSHASSDVFAKQWYDSRFPVMYGGIDVKSQDSDFFQRVGGKSLDEFVSTFAVDAPLSPVTQPFYKEFREKYHRDPVYTGAGAYDGLLAYQWAVEQAKTTETDAVIKALEKLDLPGVAGRMGFDESHDLKYGADWVGYYFTQWRADGTRTVVFPVEQATGKIETPPWITKKQASN
jgi:branched-chain amino acid transport system substrate-binding protein